MKIVMALQALNGMSLVVNMLGYYSFSSPISLVGILFSLVAIIFNIISYE